MDQLHEYRHKRDFKKTSEPRAHKGKRSGAHAPGTALKFTVQKHDATSLHYDFRLELDGVLVSWAVPKGPSLDPSAKRLAIETEGHPLEYGDFEGVIPEGQYGGGTVLVWDRGTWSPQGDARAGYRDGHLKFSLTGQKLNGSWHLVRRGEGKQWLLFKSKDSFARKGPAAALVDRAPESAISGRSLAEVAQAAHGTRAKQPHEAPPNVDPRALPGARTAKLRGDVAPELATLVTEVPDGVEWLHEVKFDGYRILLQLEGKQVRCLTRRGNDWAARMPSLVRAAAELGFRDALLDGEVCVLERDGTTNFQRLQNSLNAGADDTVVYYAFDLLHFAGKDLRAVPLLERKRALSALLSAAKSPQIRYSDHVVGRGPDFFREASERGLEGIVCKRLDSPYRSGRTRDWLKVKCIRRHEVVIGGFTDPGGSRSHFGALLVGTHDEHEKLVYRGKVGTGFTERTLGELLDRLRKLEQQHAAFLNPPRGAAARGVHWVKPALLAEVEYTELTREGKLRHPRFRGLRLDKTAAAVVLEDAAPQPPKKVRAVPPSNQELPVALTHPDRLLYPDQGLTKRALAEYYVSVAEWMLPHVKNRILTLVRCPQGQQGGCFFQKHAGKGVPEALRQVPVREQNAIVNYLAVDDVLGLVSLVQIGALEIHVWGSHADRPDRPDQLVFDLDPDSGIEWKRVIEAAFTVKAQLSELGLESFLKTSGGKGLHVVVPVQRRSDWERTKTFSRAVAERICRSEPEKYVCTMSKAKRKGRIFIDYLRNARGATSVCAFSARARNGAPVSTPLGWDELTTKLRPDAYTVLTLPDRLASLSRDPWEDYGKVQQSITQRMLSQLGVT